MSEGWLEANRGKGTVLHFHWPAHHYTRVSRSETRYNVKRWVAQLRQAKRLGYSLVWTAHNLYPHDALHPALQHAARLELIQQCDAIIAHCRAAKTLLTETFGADPGKLHVIPHGNYIEAYPEAPPRGDARASVGLPADAFIYLVFGAIRPYKGIERLLQAFPKVGDAHDRLLVAGGVPRGAVREVKDHFRALSAHDSRVRLDIKFIQDGRVPSYFAAADVVVLPYARTLTSGAAQLAQTFGCPLIAPRQGCLPELIDRSDLGLLYEPNRTASLIEALRKARYARFDSARISARASNQGWEKIASATLKCYREAITAARSGRIGADTRASARRARPERDRGAEARFGARKE